MRSGERVYSSNLTQKPRIQSREGEESNNKGKTLTLQYHLGVFCPPIGGVFQGGKSIGGSLRI